MRLKKLLKDKRGSDSIEFLASAAMLLLFFVALISIMAYVMQSYNANYVCRRVVRSIEVSGEYDASNVQTLVTNLSGNGMENVAINVNATYFRDNKIQLRNTFTVTLTANYKIVLLSLGGSDIDFLIPINVPLKGMSEVYWKST